MRRAIRVLVSITTLAVAAACAAPPPPPPPAPAGPTPAEMVAAADALDNRFLEAFNKGDVDALVATYWNSPNVIMMAPDGVARGIDGVRASMTGMVTAMPGMKLEMFAKRNDAVGDVVIGSGTFKLTIPAKPKPQVMEGRFSDVKAMRDGKWVYLMDHASVQLPPPPTAKK